MARIRESLCQRPTPFASEDRQTLHRAANQPVSGALDLYSLEFVGKFDRAVLTDALCHLAANSINALKERSVE